MRVDDVEGALALAEKRHVKRRRIPFAHPERRRIDDKVGRGDSLSRRGVAAELERGLVVGGEEASVPVDGGLQVDRRMSERAELIHILVENLASTFLVAREQKHLGSARDCRSMKDGERRGPRAAYGDLRAIEGEARALEIPHAASTVGVESDERVTLLHEDVRTVRKLRRCRPRRGSRKRLGLVRRRDVRGKEVARCEKRLSLYRRRAIHQAIFPRETELPVNRVVHHGRLRVGHRVPEHVELLRSVANVVFHG